MLDEQDLIMEIKVFRENGKIFINATGFHPLLEQEGNVLPIEDVVTNIDEVPNAIQFLSRLVLKSQQHLTTVGLVEYRRRNENFKKGLQC